MRNGKITKKTFPLKTSDCLGFEDLEVDKTPALIHNMFNVSKLQTKDWDFLAKRNFKKYNVEEEPIRELNEEH